MRWRFPTTIPPRYTPGQANDHRGPGVAPDTDRVPDASRLSPPIRMAGGTPLDLEVEVCGPVRSIASSLHAVRLDLDDGTVRIAPSGTATCDRDFVLAFRTREEAVAARAWTDGTHTLVRVEPPIFARETMPRDAVFVVDISGSMGGTKMVAAKRALASALHGLSPGDRFAVIAFDDRVDRFRPDLVAYDDASLGAADAWIAALDARGGTEMLPAIVAALAGDTPAGRLRTVLFVTDGQATNDAELIAAIANRRGAARFFTLGIDTAVNAALMRSLARAGGGVAELCTPEDDIEGVVARIESRFGSPLVDDVRVEGGIAARPEPAALFSGRAVSILVEGASNEVIVTGRAGNGPVRLTAVPHRVAFPLGALWARDRVAYLEDRLVLRPFEEEAIRPEVLRIALMFQIASKYTAFVAVDRRTVVVGERVEVVQPAELAMGWQPGFLGAAASPMAQPAAMPSRSMMPPPSPAPMNKASPMPPPSPMPVMGLADIDGNAAYGGGAAPGAKGKRATGRRAEAPAAAEEAPAFEPSPIVARESAPAAGPAAATDVAGELARSQAADGSFGRDVRRTAAALIALVVLGHTRLAGVRQRTVAKAAAWLAGRSEPEAIAAIAFLEAKERGEEPIVGDLLQALRSAGAEGAALGTLLRVAP